MITQTIISIFVSVILFFLNLLPEFTVPVSDINAATDFFISFVNQTNYFLPVATIFTILGILISYNIVKFVFALFNWIRGT